MIHIEHLYKLHEELSQNCRWSKFQAQLVQSRHKVTRKHAILSDHPTLNQQLYFQFNFLFHTLL